MRKPQKLSDANSSRPISPGAYLTKRRQQDGKGLAEVARTLMALPMARVPTSPFAVGYTAAALEEYLARVEADQTNLTLPHAILVAKCFRFNPDIYMQLLLLHSDQTADDLPVPQLCRVCACSWHDPCRVSVASPRLSPSERSFLVEPCRWAEPDLCTACQHAEARLAPAQPYAPVEGAPA